MGGCENDGFAVAADALGGDDGAGGVRIENIAVAFFRCLDAGGDVVFRGRGRGEVCLKTRPKPSKLEAAGGDRDAIELRMRSASRPDASNR